MGEELTAQDWQRAKTYLDEKRQQYNDIGAAGVPVLRLFIDPLLVRYEMGGNHADRVCGLATIIAALRDANLIEQTEKEK